MNRYKVQKMKKKRGRRGIYRNQVEKKKKRKETPLKIFGNKI